MLSPCSLLNSNSSICGRHPMMSNRKAGLAIGCHSIVAFAVRTCMNMLKHVKNCANLQKSAGILCYSSLAIHLQGHKGVQMFSMHYVPPSHFPREHRNGFLHNIIHIYMVEKKLELKVYSLCFVVFICNVIVAHIPIHPSFASHTQPLKALDREACWCVLASYRRIFRV